MNGVDQAKVAEILLVEDSPTDVLMTQEALRESRVLNQLHVVDDGEEAIAYLRKLGKYGNVPDPDLVLLDLNLPKKSGREVLAEIKEDPVLRIIPVVMLTTSRAEEDILRSYGLHANSYIVKPVSFDQFVETIQALERFWFQVVTLPPRH